ncbi:MAG: hypothetical protein ACLRSW_15170 [Christensenellaceae bacterium]
MLQRGYIPVYRLSAEAEYVWETGGSKSASQGAPRKENARMCADGLPRRLKRTNGRTAVRFIRRRRTPRAHL